MRESAAEAPKKIFLSWVHRDPKLKEALLADLRPALRLLPDISIEWWEDSHLTCGKHLLAGIIGRLDEADYGLLLVSNHYFGSDFIQRSGAQSQGRDVLHEIPAVHPTHQLPSPTPATFTVVPKPSRIGGIHRPLATWATRATLRSPLTPHSMAEIGGEGPRGGAVHITGAGNSDRQRQR